MRVLSVLGALLFAYLALIPGELIVSTLDSSCAGAGCETSTLSKVLFTVVYAIALVALLGTALLMAHNALRDSAETQRRIPWGLGASAAAAALLAFSLFAVTYPVAALVAVGIGASSYLLIRRYGRRSGSDSPPRGGVDPRSNGHSTNGRVH